MLSRLTTDVLSYNPSVVSIVAGTNDIGNTTPATTIINNLSSMLTALRAQNITVYLGTIPPRCSTVTFDPLTTQQLSDFQAVNTWIRARHNGDTIRVADWTNALSTGDGTYPNLTYFSDHVHPNDAGRGIMASVLSQVM